MVRFIESYKVPTLIQYGATIYCTGMSRAWTV